MVLAACGGPPEPAPSGEPLPPPVDPEPEPEPTERMPLTGVEVAEGAVPDRPVLAAKVDNHARARPQTGLERADVVFEVLVEHGVTRFLALYHADVPDLVGPLRSARESDVDLLRAHRPLLGHSGAVHAVQNQLRSAEVRFFEEGQTTGFTRSPDRPRPHNLYLEAPGFLEANGEGLPTPERTWEFDEQEPSDGRRAEEVEVRFSPQTTTTWSSGDEGRWRRGQDGQPHHGAHGEALEVDNVVVVQMPMVSSGRTDGAGSPVPRVDSVGSGDAWLLRDGRVLEIGWDKPSASAQLELVDGRHDAVLRPGRTWVAVVPPDRSPEVRAPSAGAGTSG